MSPLLGATRSAARPATAALASRTKAVARSGSGPKRRQRIPGAKKIVMRELPGFSRQLASMLSAGMPIVSCLETLADQADNPNFKGVIAQVARNVENGAAFSEALRQFPRVFNDLYCNMVKGGETGGQLAETVGRLAGFLEASAKLRRKVKSAMMYPAIVLFIAIGIATGMIIFIVPVFGEMFSDFGAELPGPTQFLLNFSNGLRSNGLYVLAGVIVVVVVFKKWKNSSRGGYTFDSLLLKAPVFGELKPT